MSIPEQYSKAGRITSEVRAIVRDLVRPGASYLKTCVSIEEEISRRGGSPAFPTGIGVNAVTAHYAPQEDDESRFLESDLVKVDFGVEVEGYVADTAVSVTFNPEYELMLDATERALNAAIAMARKETRTGEIGGEIFKEASRFGFKTIQNLTGHTLDRYVVHAGKSIPNLFVPNLPQLKKGDVFAIEPFLTVRSAAGYVVDSPHETIFSIAARRKTNAGELDSLTERIWSERRTLPFTPRWYAKDYGEERLQRMLKELVKKRVMHSYPTLVEASGKPVAQFEHTMALGEKGLVVLT
ncbi:MAG TPA: type II methionyl aminopeptidase [Nitrososphaerales archaeon]|nr:type II methionyl aminopeptidase [Nitrososphaerales archaeon]